MSDMNLLNSRIYSLYDNDSINRDELVEATTNLLEFFQILIDVDVKNKRAIIDDDFEEVCSK